ncbi:hypothetical protein BURPS1710b_2223 [Burkholderia pseudomallei 1710b]|uniref:Uncharacterized protein n=1 Tax=Burkholderia pseudomallei (strain 1710b) TaxID=320372 RepID=Q3JS36_BURP1|nr:hypothetical protein BURPS1710b_2223 [Burkholderia pseudomallei 1710b]
MRARRATGSPKTGERKHERHKRHPRRPRQTSARASAARISPAATRGRPRVGARAAAAQPGSPCGRADRAPRDETRTARLAASERRLTQIQLRQRSRIHALVPHLGAHRLEQKGALQLDIAKATQQFELPAVFDAGHRQRETQIVRETRDARQDRLRSRRTGQSLRERFAEFDARDGQHHQRRHRRVMRSEIAEHDAVTLLPQPLQAIEKTQRFLRRRHFRHFERELAARDIERLDRQRESLEYAFGAQLGARKPHRQRRHAGALLLPARELPARLAERVAGDPGRRAQSVRGGVDHTLRQRAPFRMIPSYRRFGARHGPGADRDDRLIIHDEFSGLECPLEIGLVQRQSVFVFPGKECTPTTRDARFHIALPKTPPSQHRSSRLGDRRRTASSHDADARRPDRPANRQETLNQVAGGENHKSSNPRRNVRRRAHPRAAPSMAGTGPLRQGRARADHALVSAATIRSSAFRMASACSSISRFHSPDSRA